MPLEAYEPGNLASTRGDFGAMTAMEGHHFWPEALSLLDFLPPGQVIPHSLITDLYLLGVALPHGGKRATLDRCIAADLIKGGKSTLVVIAQPAIRPACLPSNFSRQWRQDSFQTLLAKFGD
jgi:hypothetical protein